QFAERYRARRPFFLQRPVCLCESESLCAACSANCNVTGLICIRAVPERIHVYADWCGDFFSSAWNSAVSEIQRDDTVGVMREDVRWKSDRTGRGLHRY